MKTPELKPCPFCGGEAKPFDLYDGTLHGVKCMPCGVNSAVSLREEDVIDVWNRRVTDAHS